MIETQKIIKNWHPRNIRVKNQHTVVQIYQIKFKAPKNISDKLRWIYVHETESMVNLEKCIEDCKKLKKYFSVELVIIMTLFSKAKKDLDS